VRSPSKIVLVLACCLLARVAPARAAEFFVAPAGSDDAPGTIDQPFASVLRAQQAARAGDTVLLRGGTYAIRESQVARRQGIFAYVIPLDKSGEKDRPITYRAYKDERPVFDFSAVKPEGLRVYAFSVTGSWLHFVGIEVVGVQVTARGHTQSICFESNGSHNVFERLAMHDGQAIGLYHVRGSGNLFLNCDAWNNWDSTSENGKGGNVDGFGCHPSPGSTGNVFRGCRAWFNSDDGFDCINSFEAVTFENCWAAYNGYSTKFESLGDGNGFKAGGYGRTTPSSRVPEKIPRHVIRFCVAVGNKANGFYANHHPGGSDWINNTAFHNGNDFNMLGRDLRTHTDCDGFGHTLRSNLGYRARGKEIDKIDRSKCDAANNSFDPGAPALADKDFASLDEGEFTRPRQANGDLPVIRFLHPASRGALNGRGAFGP
jgi:hypothetical protein